MFPLGLGDIETSDIGGRVCLLTQGGNITAGRIGMEGPALARGDRPVAKIETQGGHITLRDVAGDLDAYTAGGHILAGNIDGNARLHTGGGHIRAARIKGTARLESDAGGNIAIGEAGARTSPCAPPVARSTLARCTARSMRKRAAVGFGSSPLQGRWKWQAMAEAFA